MRKIYILFLISISSSITVAQNNVGVGTTTPDVSAKLEVTSTTQGFLMPRMTEAQRSAIISPATGLMVYQTNNSDGTYYYDGTQWRNLSDNLGNHTATQTLNMDTNTIINVPAPVNGLDAVNKDYVDAQVSGGGGGGSGCCHTASEVSLEGGPFSNVMGAFEYCDTLSEAGNSDWRIPYMKEITDGLAGQYVIPGTYTTNTLWTQEQVNGTAAHWRTYRLSDGYLSATTGTASGIYVRCVRGN